MIKAVIFDFDDTLIRSSHSTIKGCIFASRTLGLRVPPENEVARLLGLPWSEVVKSLHPEIEEEDFNKAYIKCGGNEGSYATKGAKVINKKLREANIFTGIISSRDMNSIYDKLEKTGFDKTEFDHIEAHTKEKFSKPDPRVFNHLLQKLSKSKLLKSEIVYVGDAIYDYLAANGAGLNFIAFINGAYSKEEFMEAGLEERFTMESFEELPHILQTNFKVESLL